MSTKWLFVAVAWFILGAALLGCLLRSSPGPTAAADGTSPSVRLPIIVRPENLFPPTPTSPPPEPTREPPTDGNWIINGSFEDDWADLPPVWNLTNQQPNGWTLDWLEPGALIWADAVATAGGVPECLHKLDWQLPPHEQPGGPNALILDGERVYKTFHAIAPFGTQLYQRLERLPAGSWRLVVPAQLHTRGDLDPWTAESGVWVLVGDEQAGGWANAGTMGDHQWFRHLVEFETSPGDVVEVLIRVKSKWAGRDFFIDAISLERIDEVSTGRHRQSSAGRVLWLPRPLARIPADELVQP